MQANNRTIYRRDFLRAAGTAGIAAGAALWAACRPVQNRTVSRGPDREASAPGVTADTITIGTLYPLTGPAAAYAMSLQAMDAYFRRVNDEGGVNGRMIKLVVA